MGQCLKGARLESGAAEMTSRRNGCESIRNEVHRREPSVKRIIVSFANHIIGNALRSAIAIYGCEEINLKRLQKTSVTTYIWCIEIVRLVNSRQEWPTYI